MSLLVNLGEEDQDAYDINKLKKPVNGTIPGLNGKTLSEADTLLVRGKIHRNNVRVTGNCIQDLTIVKIYDL